MNSKIYRQADSRWGSLPYPTRGSSFAGNGCGACAVLHCIIERSKYKNWDPRDIQPYMKGWAVSGQGTLWKGIYEALKHYGMENVKWFGANDPMSSIFKELNKGSRVGVILFGSTLGPDGTCWTGSGHYIAFLDYRVRNGKHEFYLKDSGGRCHDGWYSYEKSMRGDVRQVWTCTVPGEAKKDDNKKDTKATSEKVIDVSFNQTNVNWDKVKADGVKGVIVRCGFRGYGSGKLQEDSQFMSHIKGASKAGLKVGVYFFTEAINSAEGKEEAAYALKLINKAGVKLSYPIAIDTEDINASNPTPRANASVLSRAKRTAAVKGFCEYIKAQGYEPMIYASTSWLNNQLDMSQLPYKVWCAQYYKECQYKGAYVMWQYSSTGSVSGIKGNCDMNHWYGGTTPAPAPTPTKKKSVDEIAKEVIAGKWGDGNTRKKKLEAAGYDYNAVQKRVNAMLSKPAKKSNEQIAREIIAGKWGDGNTRKKRLEAAGYDYNAIQKIVNKLMK